MSQENTNTKVVEHVIELNSINELPGNVSMLVVGPYTDQGQCYPIYRAKFDCDPKVIYSVPWYSKRLYYMPAPEVDHV